MRGDIIIGDIREIPYDEAKEEIRKYIEKHPKWFVSDILVETWLGFEVVEKVLIELGYKNRLE